MKNKSLVLEEQEKLFKRAVRGINRGSSLSNSRARTNLLRTSYRIIERLVKLDYAPAFFEYAAAHEDTGFLGENKKLAFRYYKKAAEANVVESFNSLGCSFYGGYGTRKNRKAAEFWFRKAAKSGDPMAMFNFALGLRNRKPDEAFRWLLKSAGMKYEDSMIEVALMYEKGKGTRKSLKLAIAWLEKAAKISSFGEAEFHLGRIYEQNPSLKKGHLATKWYQRAAARGSEEARTSLKDK